MFNIGDRIRVNSSNKNVGIIIDIKSQFSRDVYVINFEGYEYNPVYMTHDESQAFYAMTLDFEYYREVKLNGLGIYEI